MKPIATRSSLGFQKGSFALGTGSYFPRGKLLWFPVIYSGILCKTFVSNTSCLCLMCIRIIFKAFS